MTSKFMFSHDISFKNIMRNHIHTPPKNQPPTQSIFYMPFITIAYMFVSNDNYMRNKTTLPNKILDELGYFFTIVRETNFDVSFGIFCGVICGICEYLVRDNNLEQLRCEYMKDGKIPIDAMSHVDVGVQECILDRSTIAKNIISMFAESLFNVVSEDTKTLLMDIVTDDTINDVRTMLDVYIETYYSQRC